MASSSKPTVPEVLKWLKDLHDWFTVGERVGVRFGKLDDLDEMYPSEPEKATKKMVELWLEKDAHASWAKLANALEYARQYALAKRIRETYKCPKPPRMSRASVPAPRRQEKADESQNTQPGPATSYPTPPPSPPPSPPPYRIPNKSFECSCKSFVPILKRRKERSGGKMPLLPNLILEASERVVIEGKLKEESDEMILRFGGFVSRVLRSFKSRSISAPALVKSILNFKALPSSSPDSKPPSLLQHRAKQLRSMNSVDDIVLLVSDYVSFFNHALLVHLVKELGSEDDQEELDTFLVYFQAFVQRDVFDVPAYMFGYVWLKTEMLVVLKVAEKGIPDDSYNLKRLYKCLQNACVVMKVLPHVLHVCSVDRGSLELACRMPPHVAGEVFPLSTEQENALGQTGVMELHCADYCFRMPDAKRPKAWNMVGGSAIKDSRSTQSRHQRRPGKKAQKIVENKSATTPGTEELMVGQLKLCCYYHEQMNRLRNQSCALVTEGDMGYDGDSESSTDEGPYYAEFESYRNLPVQHSRKRLKWCLAHAQF